MASRLQPGVVVFTTRPMHLENFQRLPAVADAEQRIDERGIHRGRVFAEQRHLPGADRLADRVRSTACAAPR